MDHEPTDDGGAPGEGVPDYEPMLAAYHRAFAAELRATIEALPIREGDRVLDLACGDGAYSAWLAGRVGPAGAVTAVDILPAYLDEARRRAGDAPRGDRVRFAAAEVGNLPFADGAFDLAWCAQSLYSLPDPVESVRALTRVVRPGGAVAVLEDDTLHHVLLPWPVDLELHVRRAELDAFRAEADDPEDFYVGRRLRAVFEAAGLVGYRQHARATVRLAPLGPDDRAFLAAYLRDLRDRVGPRLGRDARAEFETFVAPASAAYILDRPDLVVTCLDHLALGFKAGPDGTSGR